MTNIIQFKPKPQDTPKLEKVYVCDNCKSHEFRLLVNTQVRCQGCGNIISSLIVYFNVDLEGIP